MEPAVAIREPNDEVLQTAAQFGIKNIVVYSGPGSPGVGKPRKDFSDYVALRMRIKSFGLKLVAIEGGFSPHRKYDDVVFGGPKQDELIELFFLPPYSPELNPDEMAWGHVKQEVGKAGLMTMAALTAQARRALRRLQRLPETAAGFFRAPSCAQL